MSKPYRVCKECGSLSWGRRCMKCYRDKGRHQGTYTKDLMNSRFFEDEIRPKLVYGDT